MDSRIEGEIRARALTVGRGVIVEHDVLIAGQRGPAERVVIGDHVFIGRGTRIMVPEFTIGEYTKLNAYAYAYGDHPLHIGRMCWFGGNVVLDTWGGLTIADGVAVGSGSQLWTHCRAGDIVEGCRFDSAKAMTIGPDAWLVGHCLLSPVQIGAKAMALLGAVVTRDMQPNHVYGGVPAVDLTAHLGEPFAPLTPEAKGARLAAILDAWWAQQPQYRGQLRVAYGAADRQPGLTSLDVINRTYTKTGSAAEVAFFKAFVPRIKFYPEAE